MLTVIPGIKALVVPTTIDELNAVGQRIGIKNYGYRTVALTGGFYSMMLPSMEVLKSANIKMATEEEIIGRQCEGSHIIAMVTDVASVLKPEELKAVLLHEQGHICYRHMEKPVSTISKGGFTIVESVSNEIEADAYAVRFTGKKTMAIALTKIILCSNDIVHKFLKASYNPSEVLLNPMIRQRMIALQ